MTTTTPPAPRKRASPSVYLPWTDAAGRFSPVVLVVFLALLTPGALLAFDFASGNLGPRPWNLAIHRAGWWTVVFLLASLAVTPLRRTLRWSGLVGVRRMIGVAAFVAATFHLALYAGEQAWDLLKISSEIVLRIYLTIGFAALLGLSALAVTSTDGTVRRLGGKRWQILHRLTYPVAVLALVHFFMQIKADITQPILFSGLFIWLMAYRLWRSRLGDPGTGGLVALAVAAGLLTAIGETFGIAWVYHASVWTIVQAHFDTAICIRPAWWVLAAGLAVTAAAALRRLPRRVLT